MKLVLTLLVRDEEDIIYENILYHLNQGVDFIIATDNLSVDNTQSILRDFEKQGVLTFIQEKEDTYAQSRWVTRMARLAATEYQADWVINCDADEFWWPIEGNLKQSIVDNSSNFDVINVDRHNFCPLWASAGPWYENMVYRVRNSLNHLGAKLVPKACHRGISEVVVAQGNHYLEFPPGLKTSPEKPVEILHFPIRSPSQFENKIICGGSAYSRNNELSEDIGDCWRKLFEDWQHGKLDDFLKEQILTENQLECSLEKGTIVEDTRLRDFLHDHISEIGQQNSKLSSLSVKGSNSTDLTTQKKEHPSTTLNMEKP